MTVQYLSVKVEGSTTGTGDISLLGNSTTEKGAMPTVIEVLP